jgi:molybdopterin molybdotransferase
MADVPFMVGPDEALAMVLRAARPLPARSVPLAEACGLRLAEPVAADRDYPPFPRAMMDGYAVRCCDAGKPVRVAGEVAAGQATPAAVTEGCCLEIMTGAPCPALTEAVVPKEEVQRQGAIALLPPQIPPGQHIAPQGSECRSGQVLLEPGAAITPLAVAALASIGRSAALVTARPSLAVITTGGELVPADQAPGEAQIRDSNGPMLAALAGTLRLDRPRLLHAVDRVDSILAALRQAGDRDIILLSGGVSTGTYDLVPSALGDFGAELVFHKVRQKPGKPLLLARRGPQLLFGLPGNPLACHFCFHRYVAAAARQMAGASAEVRPLEGRMAAAIRGAPARTFFATARALPELTSPTGWRIEPMTGVSSADVFTTCRANCYVEVPPGAAGLGAGQVARFAWIAPPALDD